MSESFLTVRDVGEQVFCIEEIAVDSDGDHSYLHIIIREHDIPERRVVVWNHPPLLSDFLRFLAEQVPLHECCFRYGMLAHAKNNLFTFQMRLT